MTQRLFIIFFFSSTLSLGQTEADTVHPIDKTLLKCFPEEGTRLVDKMKCYAAAMESWEKEIKKYYELLLTSTLKQDIKTKLFSSQTAWTTYKDKEFALLSATYYTNFSIDLQINALAKQTDILKDRALELKMYHDLKLGQ